MNNYAKPFQRPEKGGLEKILYQIHDTLFKMDKSLEIWSIIRSKGR